MLNSCRISRGVILVRIRPCGTHHVEVVAHTGIQRHVLHEVTVISERILREQLVISHHVTRLLSAYTRDHPDLRERPCDAMQKLWFAIKSFAEEPRLYRVHRVMVTKTSLISGRVGGVHGSTSRRRIGVNIRGTLIEEWRIRVRDRWVLRTELFG
jgi:hypothetical protein